MNAVARRFDELVEAFVKDEQSYILHGSMFQSMAEERPQVLYVLRN